VLPYSIWVGHTGDARDPRKVHDARIVALVDLAANEPPLPVSRDLVYCRFPLVDGAGNPIWLLRLAIDTIGALVRSKTPTLVFCSGGMSRSVAATAAAISAITGRPLEDCLADVVRTGAADVSPAFWRDIVSVQSATRGPSVVARAIQ
jgi:hypothetical protein